MKRFELKKEEYEAIKEAERATEDKNVSKRLRVLMLRYEGYTAIETARIMGIHRVTVYTLQERYRSEGLERFARNNYAGGNHQALTNEQEKAILDEFEKKAQEGQIITAQDIKAAFDKVRGKDTGRGYIYMLLERHGWRKVMPRSRHPKAASEEACEASKKLSKMCWKPEKTCPRTQRDACD